MNILLIGSGGREHALLYAIKQSPLTQKLYVSPGNGGMREWAETAPIDSENHSEVLKFCEDEHIGLVIIGPEAPLAAGLSDSLTAAGVKVFGPSQAAARLEASKGFMKRICDKYHIPTAAYSEFSDAEKAKAYIQLHGAPIVVKADGLAAGKGVVVANTIQEACDAVDDILGGRFGSAGASVVVEEFLDGEEVSFFAVVDGQNAVAFGSAQDHKRVGDGDTGPNTGGMGTYSPAPIFTQAMQEQVMRTIIAPTVNGMAQEGTPFKGVLFAGLMLTAAGVKLLEFNVRFGDPETQVLMKRLKTDIVEILLACAEGDLEGRIVEMHEDAAVCVVMAAKGYPGAYQKHTEIRNIDAANALPGVHVFHAGTEYKDGKYLATGGRVLGVTATAKTIEEAQQQAYKAVKTIDWPEGFYRNDIAWRAVQKKAS